MNFTLLLSVAVFASLGLGAVLMVLGLRNAPEGFEDESGFQYGEAPVALIPVSAAIPDFAVCLEEEMAFATR